MVMRLTVSGFGGWLAVFALLGVAGAGCGNGVGSGCGGPSGTAACAPSALAGAGSFRRVPLPPVATLLHEESGALNEGVGYEQAWATSPCSPDEVAAWLDRAASRLTRETTSASAAWRSEDRVSVGLYADRAAAGAPEGAPAGTQTWISMRWEDAGPGSLACPPCPEGYDGTLLPGCECP
ncbi:MAG: hypothetical protein DRJ42_23155 [Deltaproteobacteria bacterium]|nr:MAG: hypothetical protein DRJ42_23155 [Deltaproteobacteria bacterium]